MIMAANNHSVKILAGLVFSLSSTSLLAASISADLQEAMNTGADVSYIVKFREKAVLPTYSNLRNVTGRERREILRELRLQAYNSQQSVREILKNRVKKMTSLWSVNALSATSSPEVIDEIAVDPEVESITLDATLTAPISTLAVESPAEWNLDVTGAPVLWDMGIAGSGIVVANMDTGVDMIHPDLRRRWRRGSNSWFDPNGEHSSPYDSAGHGTQTMGIMVGGDSSGNSIGMAPDSKWIAVKIFNDAGVATISSIHQGFQWLLDPDEDINTDDAPNVVNGSWGFTELLGQCFTEFDADLALLRAAGISVAFASGNQGPNSNTSVSPANNPSGYAVGAVDSSLNVSSISGRGPSACGGGMYPNIVAPGIGIKTTDLTFGGIFPSSYAYVSGTSAAAPHVAGAMALLRQAYPDATVTDIENALALSATDIDQAGVDDNSGHGLVNVAMAYSILGGGGVPTNSVPVARNDSYQVNEGDVLNVSLPGLLQNDTDADGDLLSVDEIPVSDVTGGQLTLFTDGSFVYTPNQGTTSDSFIYTVSDGTDSAQAQVSITVIPQINNAPVPSNDSYTVVEGGLLIVSSPGLLGNDSDPDGDTLSLVTTPVSGPGNGQLTLFANGGFEYSPNPGALSDSFIYEVSDGTVTTQANVFITVEQTPQNNPPVALADVYEVSANSTLNVAAPGLLGNDSDLDGDMLVVNINPIQSTVNGLLTLSTNGSFSYTPNPGATTDSFIYEINDGTDTAQAMVVITINPEQNQNTAPVAVADTITTVRNSSDVFIDLTSNDYDSDGNLKNSAGNVLAGQINLDSGTSTTRRGTLTVVDNGVLYTPRRNFRGTDTFTYSVNDQQGLASNSVTVTIIVNR